MVYLQVPPLPRRRYVHVEAPHLHNPGHPDGRGGRAGRRGAVLVTDGDPGGGQPEHLLVVDVPPVPAVGELEVRVRLEGAPEDAPGHPHGEEHPLERGWDGGGRQPDGEGAECAGGGAGGGANQVEAGSARQGEALVQGAGLGEGGGGGGPRGGGFRGSGRGSVEIW